MPSWAGMIQGCWGACPVVVVCLIFARDLHKKRPGVQFLHHKSVSANGLLVSNSRVIVPQTR